MKISVITSCTSRKKYKAVNQLQPQDFLSTERLAARSAELKSYETIATDMYTGQQHRHLKAGLEQLRAYYKEAIIDLYIISAGYGLLNESDVIVPYNVTFTGLNKKELLERSNGLQLHERIKTLITHYDLVLFLLGAEYVRALQLPFKVPDTVTQIFLIGTGARKLIPNLPNTHFVPAGTSLRHKLHTTNTTLKGLVFERLCAFVCREGLQVFEKIRQNPQRILDVALANR
ncbi:MAG: peroxide stress protein YaaA [Candidatus Poribacteria bacterium]|nr:peroxide stress protein YaaA [Candidatus Poribacteria bacterium]